MLISLYPLIEHPTIAKEINSINFDSIKLVIKPAVVAEWSNVGSNSSQLLWHSMVPNVDGI